MTRSARTSDRLERAARRAFRPLCGAVVVLVLFLVANADETNPGPWFVVKVVTGGLFIAWAGLAVGAGFTEPEGRS